MHTHVYNTHVIYTYTGLGRYFQHTDLLVQDQHGLRGQGQGRGGGPG